jgi:hypothetical protein
MSMKKARRIGFDMKDPEKLSVRISLAISVTLVVLVALYVYTFGFSLSDNREHWGQFGDLLGGVLNPLISFFVLAVAFQVWRLQEHELTEKRKALTQQVQTNELQRFENTLFKLVEHSHRSIDTYSVRRENPDFARPRLASMQAVQYLVEQLKVKQQFEGNLSAASVKSFIEEHDAYGFFQTYIAIKYAYLFSVEKCPVSSKSTEYVAMTCMLLGDDLMKLSQFWAVGLNDQTFIEALPKD